MNKLIPIILFFFVPLSSHANDIYDQSVLKFYKNKYPHLEDHFQSEISKLEYKDLFSKEDTDWNILHSANIDNIKAYIVKIGPPGFRYVADHKLYLSLLDKKTKTVIIDVDLKNINFGAWLYSSQFDVFKTSDNKPLFLFQVRYGGDGDHTENIIKVFKLKKLSPQKVYEGNISNVEFFTGSGVLKSIRGNYIETLCDVCDGWEVSSPKDIFKLPLEISTTDFKATALMNSAEKKELMTSLKLQAESNIKEQLSHGNKSYPKYANGVIKRITEILSGNALGELKTIKSKLLPEYEAEDFINHCSLGCAMGWDLESSSSLAKQRNNSYDVMMLKDGSPNTAWVEGVSGDGIGEYVLFKFPKIKFTESAIGDKINFNGFLMLNGYLKNEKTWKNNSRVRKIKIYHNDTPIYAVDLFDSMKLQEISFDTVWLRHGDTVKVEILEVFKGLKYSDTAITELEPTGAH